jgi:hypothetical protein
VKRITRTEECENESKKEKWTIKHFGINKKEHINFLARNDCCDAPVKYHLNSEVLKGIRS